VHGTFTPADRHLDAYPDVPSPDIRDIYPPRPGKPEYAGSVEFWVPGEDGQPVEKEHNHAYNQPGRPLNDWIRQYHQGFAWGQHGFRHKVAPYFANIAAPLIFRLPDNLTAGRRGTVVDHPVSGVDLPVTFFSLAQIELPWRMDGWDLSPLLHDPHAPWDHPAMMVSTGTNYGSNTDTIPPKDDRRLYMGPGVPWYVILAKGRYKYIRTLVEGETDELYDMISDPEELHNLAGDPAYGDYLEYYRQAAIDELKRTGARFADHLPPVQAHRPAK
jgi:arylsulfatase A-like enzyme